MDPSESVRSDEIMGLVGERFEIVYRADFGGTLLQFVLSDIAGNFDPADPKDVAMIDLVCLYEQTLIERASCRATSCTWWLSALPEEPARVEREEELLAGRVDLELVGLGQERLDGLHRPGPVLREHRMPVDVRVLDDEVAARGHEAAVQPQLVEDVVARMVGVEDHED